MAARLKVLSELTHAFAEATQNLELLHDTITSTLTRLVKDGCGLLLLSEDARELHVVSLHASDADFLRASRQVLAAQPMKIEANPRIATVLDTGLPIVFSKAASGSESTGLLSAYEVVSRAFGVHSRMTVALRLRGKAIGLLNMVRFRQDSPPFDDRDVELLQIVADNAALAITNARSYAAERAARLNAEGVEQRLRDYQHRLQRMAFDAAVAEERERHRLALLLHDGIAQDLALIQLKLASLRPNVRAEEQGVLDQVLALLSKSARDCSTLTFELSPPLLYDLGLHAALSWLIEELEAKRGLRTVLTDDRSDKPLEDTTAAIAYRAVRELLINVSKHAQVAEARVQLRRADDSLEIVVEDAGVGFDVNAAHAGARDRGFGLLSLREQIDRLGGTFEIKSTRGQGTSARIRVALEASSLGCALEPAS